MRTTMNVEKLVRMALAHSKYKRAAEAAGFTFGEPEIQFSLSLDQTVARLPFTCVCGKQEVITQVFDPLTPPALDLFDLTASLHSGGSFSYDHLIKDGYTEEQARDIERKYKEALQ